MTIKKKEEDPPRPFILSEHVLDTETNVLCSLCLQRMKISETNKVFVCVRCDDPS